MLPSNKKATKEELFIDSNNQLDISCMNIGCRFNAQHLYITSDEEIKEGDWFYYEAEKTIMQCTEHNFYFTPELIQNYSNVYKIIATTDKYITIDGYDSSDEDSIVKCYLPQPSQQFIEKYIKEYNKGNVISDVEVEYDKATYDKWLENGASPVFDSLKVNPDNTINIKQIKDSWSREEIGNILNDFFNDHTNCQNANIDKWLEENL